MIGLCTRTSAWITVICRFYVLGIPQFYGKVNHYHHLLWFAAILAASRSSDMLSCDAWIAARKRADRGLIDPPGPSRLYAMPLRFVWLLIGIAYFFAGFWKWWSIGPDWAFSNNIQIHMYRVWQARDGWLPFFRIDHYPLLYQLGALGVLLFEMSFVFLMFAPKLRFAPIFGGLVFHNMTGLFMQIYFTTLQACYVAFGNWHAIFQRLGHGFYQDDMWVLYDGDCRRCRRTIASLRTLDVWGRVTYVHILDTAALAHNGLDGLDTTAVLTEMHAVVGGKTWHGFAAYRALAGRLPVLWPLLPFLYLGPVARIGGYIYRRVAHAQPDCVAAASSLPTRTATSSVSWQMAIVTTVGLMLVCANVVAGVGRKGQAWPFACYPVFWGGFKYERHALEMTVSNAQGDIIPWNPQRLQHKFSVARYWGMVGHLMRSDDTAQRDRRLKALFSVLRRYDETLRQADAVQFHRVTLSVIPERQEDNPLHQELLLDWKIPSEVRNLVSR